MIERVEVDLVRCIGCGTCWVSMPQVFRESAEYQAEVTGRLGEPSLLRRVVEECPSLAISLLGIGGRLVYPDREVLERRASSDWA